MRYDLPLMFARLSDLPEFESAGFDLVIAGAGAAGISLALELRNSGLRVGLFEAGELEPPAQDQNDPYQGETSDSEYPLALSRLRYFGGSTNHWGGWCRPLDPVDLEARPGRPVPAWPVPYAELAQHYDRARELCEIPNDFEVPALESRQVLDLGSDYQTQIYRFSPPTRFGHRYRSELDTAPNIDVFLDANLVDLQLSDDGTHAEQAVFTSFDGTRREVRCGRFVLALGGIENARMLLNWKSSRHPQGLGNNHGLVGRYFCDHLGARLAQLLAPDGLSYRLIGEGADRLMPIVSPTAEYLRQSELPNFYFIGYATKPDDGLTPAYWRNPGVGNGEEDAILYHWQVNFEPRPSADSAITLTDRPDRYGLSRLRLDWQIDPADYVDLNRILKGFARQLGVRKSGRLRLNADVTEGGFSMSPQYHHMCTTRMGSDPSEGVVDGQGRLFELDNVFVAGSSVFPSVGCVNPTLTICALAVRLAGHLRAGAAA